MEEKLVGKITHYYDKIQVAIVELTSDLKVNDNIHIKGNNTDFNQVVTSIQKEHQNVSSASKGEMIGMKVDQKVKEGDEIYLIE
ncbi:MAG: translation elongation factor-like protein [Minisyncoccia bacterium]|jgi:putative protease